MRFTAPSAASTEATCVFTVEGLSSRALPISLFERPQASRRSAYVIDWKLKLAADRLHATRDAVGVIARELGYDSEAAFSRAFKARFGLSPTAIRAQLRRA